MSVATGDIDEFGTGWKKWNPQAWVDFIMIKIMMGRVRDVIPKTYVPILRLVSDDVGKVDSEYAQVLAMRERIGWLDSPRDRWRKMYGSYVRELEWVFGELRQHFPKQEYQDLVVDIMARTIRDWLAALLPSIERTTRTGDEAKSSPHSGRREPSAISRFAARTMERTLNGSVGRFLMNHMNPVNAIVGPVEMKLLPSGDLQMYIPRCWMHTAPGDGQTQDQTCLWACKGACEQVFGPQSIAPMVFEPHLPDFSCTLSVKTGSGLPQT